ncbi:hypothetical protein [Sporomusa aerivorans]
MVTYLKVGQYTPATTEAKEIIGRECYRQSYLGSKKGTFYGA